MAMSGTCGHDDWLREREKRAGDHVPRMVPLPTTWAARLARAADVAVVALIVVCLGCILVYCARVVWIWTRG